MDPDQAKIPTATRIVRRASGGTPRRVAPISACWAPASPEFPPRSKRRVSAARSRWWTAFRRSADRRSIPSSARSAGCSPTGTHGAQLTHGIADDILRELGAQGALHYRRGGPSNTTVVMYDEIALSRWIEETIRKADITVLLGAILRGVARDGGRIRELDLATRYGDVKLRRPASSTPPATPP